MLNRFNSLHSHLTAANASQEKENEVIYTSPTPYFTKVELNRPAVLNAVTEKMISNLSAACSQWNKSEQLKVVWFAGKGGKAFCAGGDIKTLYEAKFLTDQQMREKIHDNFFRYEFMCNYEISRMKPFQISVYDGIVMGGGVGLSIYSKIKIATESTIFAMPEAKIGLYTDVSGTYFLSRLPKNIGLFLALTGTRLRGSELIQVGLADFFVRKANLYKLEQEVIACVNEKTKDQDIFNIVQKYSEKIEGEYRYSEQCHELFCGKEFKEIYEKLKSDTKYKEFSGTCLKLINEASPISLRIIFEGLKNGKNMSLSDAFKMEFRLTQRLMNDNDFFEGVRCTLIDKKDKPKWKYSSPFDVPQEEINRYFSPLSLEKELKLID